MSRSQSVIIATLISFGLIAVAVYFRPGSKVDSADVKRPLVIDDESTNVHVEEFCAACHIKPRPDLLPKATWKEEITKAYGRYHDSGRHDLKVPDQEVITEYFTRLAPAALTIPNAPESLPNPVDFRREYVDLPSDCPFSAVSFLNGVQSSSTGNQTSRDILLCDMGNGWVKRFAWSDGKVSSTPICRLKYPSHIIPCDFERNGSQDFLVSELGVFMPSDDQNGSVVLMRSPRRGQPAEQIVVSSGMGRIADAELADLDGDGDNDFIVAEFGYQKVGRLLWLETRSVTAGRPNVVAHVIDNRHGSIHAPPTDLDGDGDLDLIVLISQEFESIVAFINDGHGQFTHRTLFQADSPAFGLSGLELADLDGDGDLDVLFTNGDTLDTNMYQPTHGVNWLENLRFCEFEYHRLAALPGALRSVSGDIDGDGDLDVAAVAFCPPFLNNQSPPEIYDTIIWLEQTEPRTFVRHSLEQLTLGHMAIAIGDFDGDQDLDLAVGEFSLFDKYIRTPGFNNRHWFSVFWNESRTQRAVEEKAANARRTAVSH